MTRNNYALVVGVMLLAILLTNFGFFTAPAISQENEAQDRTRCLQNCKNLFASTAGNLQNLYLNCLTDCENKMWQQFENDMDRPKMD